MKRPLIAALFVLTACGTPQQQCIGAGTRDLHVVDRLIGETESNLARGYGYEDVTTFVPRWVDCTPYPTKKNPKPATQMCFEDVPVTTRQEVALDLGAEATKLQGLKKKRAELAKAAEPLIAQCQAKYPE